MDLKRINYKNFKNALQNMSVSDYKSFVIAFISFEQGLSYKTSELIYNDYMKSKSYNSLLTLSEFIKDKYDIDITSERIVNLEDTEQ